MRISTTPVSSIDLGVAEIFAVHRTRLESDRLPWHAKRFSVVTGTHGDELEGQYICYELIRRIREQPNHLHGTLDVYPAMNPLGIDAMSRGIPNFDLDLNRLFPGSSNGCMPEYYASQAMAAMLGSDLCVDIHSSNVFVYETPQIRANELTVEKLLPHAMLANVDLIWVHGSSTVLEATLAHSLNNAGTPCLVLETGIGMRLTKRYGDQLVDGLLNIMKSMGMWTGPVGPIRNPQISTDGKVNFINASEPGIFLPAVEHSSHVSKDEIIGSILNPRTGEVAEEIVAPCDGLMFTLRAYPVVYEGSLIARVLDDSKELA